MNMRRMKMSSNVCMRSRLVDHEREEKDGPGPVMVSDTLCPAVHILGT